MHERAWPSRGEQHRVGSRPMRTPALAPLLLAACACTSLTPEASRGTTIAPDGVEIVFETRGRGEPALVLVHGWCCDRGFWRHQVETFSRERQVVTLDLAGHGESARDRGHWDLGSLAGDVVAVADQLGLERLILVGHSMGGPICLEAAARLPGRVEAVVGVDTLHDVSTPMPRETVDGMVAAFRADFEGTLARGVAAMLHEPADPDLRRWIVERASRTDRTAALVIAGGFADVDQARLLSRAKVPVRCINAEEHPPFARATAIESNRRHGDFDALLMPGVGHYPMLEKPAGFDARLRETLAGLRGAGGGRP